MGDLLEGVLRTVTITLAGVVAVRRALRWSHHRCDDAIAAARQLPTPDRRFALVAKVEPGPLSRAQAWQLRAVQQALDDERRDGAPMALRAVPAVAPGDEIF